MFVPVATCWAHCIL